jgi:acyl carrier protein
MTENPTTIDRDLLARLFTEILGAAGISAEDDFFALNGTSLMGLRLVSRVRAVLGVEMELADLFEAPTVAALAARLDGRGRTVRAALVPRDRGPRREDDALTP